MSQSRARSVADLRVGQSGTLAEPDVDAAHRLRLAELGLRPGEDVELVQRSVAGARVVCVRGMRLAVDHATAARLLLTAGP